MEWVQDSVIQNKVERVAKELGWTQEELRRVVCMRSFGSSARAWARIWGLPRIWQQALNVEAHYIIEVISEKFDRLPSAEQEKVLIHEVLHIPKSFSGALVPHRGRGRRQHLSKDKIEYIFRLLNKR